MNKPTLCEFYLTMIGRADIEESKNNVALNARLPQASYPYGNFSDTSSLNTTKHRSWGSIGHAFAFHINTFTKIKQTFTLLFTMRFLFTRSLPFKDTNVILWLVCHPSQTPQLKMSLVHELLVKVSATISELVVFHWRVRSPTYPTITKSFYKYTRALQAKLARFKLNSQLALLS